MYATHAANGDTRYSSFSSVMAQNWNETIWRWEIPVTHLIHQWWHNTGTKLLGNGRYWLKSGVFLWIALHNYILGDNYCHRGGLGPKTAAAYTADHFFPNARLLCKFGMKSLLDYMLWDNGLRTHWKKMCQ